MNISARYRIHYSGPAHSGPRPIRIRLPSSIDQPILTAQVEQEGTVPFQRLAGESTPENSVYLGIVEPHDGQIVVFDDSSYEPESAASSTSEPSEATGGIKPIQPFHERDAICRLDTGYFDLELCRGTGSGEGASKWGIRHFMSKQEQVDLLRSGNNALGGFYGPFFTPENGLINPPEHVVAHVTVEECGPVMHRYLLSGRIPDGLRPELRGKTFSVEFTFYRDVDFFDRRYHVDHFETEVNGRCALDRITVGDEFESGEGGLVFDRFDSYNRTPYREGDPYAALLKQEVASIINESKNQENPQEEPARFAYFRNLLDRDLTNAHWDLYWRLFSYWEHALTDAQIREHLAQVTAQAHVTADANERPWHMPSQAIDVSSLKDQTIFPGAADCTAEFNSSNGRCMIWLTSQPSGGFQIVQRPQSGWVNWGTNTENESPALPVGTRIRTIYGHYAQSWRERADLETQASIQVQKQAS